MTKLLEGAKLIESGDWKETIPQLPIDFINKDGDFTKGLLPEPRQVFVPIIGELTKKHQPKRHFIIGSPSH